MTALVVYNGSSSSNYSRVPRFDPAATVPMLHNVVALYGTRLESTVEREELKRQLLHIDGQQLAAVDRLLLYVGYALSTCPPIASFVYGHLPPSTDQDTSISQLTGAEHFFWALHFAGLLTGKMTTGEFSRGLTDERLASLSTWWLADWMFNRGGFGFVVNRSNSLDLHRAMFCIDLDNPEWNLGLPSMHMPSSTNSNVWPLQPLLGEYVLNGCLVNAPAYLCITVASSNILLADSLFVGPTATKKEVKYKLCVAVATNVLKSAKDPLAIITQRIKEDAGDRDEYTVLGGPGSSTDTVWLRGIAYTLLNVVNQATTWYLRFACYQRVS